MLMGTGSRIYYPIHTGHLAIQLGLLTINRLIDPGRRIEYNFLRSINRKAALPRHADTRHCRARLCRDTRRRARLCRDTRTRAQDRVHVPVMAALPIG